MKKQKPAVTIIIPIFNTKKHLTNCLSSVLDQTLKNIEVICIDDGSTDGSWEIVQKFAGRDERIVALKQDNSGAAVARNQGLKLAKGEYIGFVDSDDYVDGDYFEKLYKTAKSQKADVAVAYVKSEFEKGDLKHYTQIDPKSYDNHYNKYNKIATLDNKLNFHSVIWLSVYRRQMLNSNKITFVPRLRTGQDHIFNLKASYFANTIVYIEKSTHYHRVIRDGSLMTHFNYIDKGLLSRSYVIYEGLKFLNSVPEYDKSIYITRVVDSIAFFYSRLIKTKAVSIKIKREISDTLASAWAKIRFKEEVQSSLTDKIDSEFVVSLSSSKRLKKYITNMHSPYIRTLNKFTSPKGAKATIKRLLKAITPYGVVVLWRRYKIHKASKRLNICPNCEQKGDFLPMKSTGGTRQKAACPNCGSLERHRLLWLFINRKIGLDQLKNKSMLHVAAEPMLEPKLRKIVGKKYLTADYLVKADVKMDITNIKYEDNNFDIIMCNHVLEHVDDDSKAMREMYRVLKPGGWAIFLVPIADMPITYENKRIKTDAGRLKHFGQIDHVRKYGRDYIDRLKNAGWKVEVYKAQDIADKKEIKRMHLIEDAEKWGFTPTEIFLCTKQ